MCKQIFDLLMGKPTTPQVAPANTADVIDPATKKPTVKNAVPPKERSNSVAGSSQFGLDAARKTGVPGLGL